MSTENWSQDVLLVCLPAGRRTLAELETVTDAVRNSGDCDVVIDFSGVDMVTCAVLKKLLRLRGMLSKHGRRLVLCSVCDAIRFIFSITTGDAVFEFARDRSVPLTEVKLFHDAGRPERNSR